MFNVEENLIFVAQKDHYRHQDKANKKSGDDVVELDGWVGGVCMASVFQWDSRAAGIEFQWLIARQIHHLLNWNQL